MSLTSFIARPEVKARFKETFQIPPSTLPTLACCEPRTKNYALIGTAFDYLIRFRLQQAHAHAVAKAWVAGHTYLHANYVVEVKSGRHVFPIIEGETLGFDLETAYQIQNAWKDARANHEEYLKTGLLTDKLLRSVLHLAQMDTYFRSGKIFLPFGEVNADDIEDLRALYNLVSLETFASQSVCVLNPVFGASELVGGADVDLVIDNMLIDFKTTKFLKITRDYVNQLLGYYTLHHIKGIVGAPEKHQIDTIGIYFSRHGYLHTWPVSDFINKKTYPEFVKWFKQTAKQVFSESLNPEAVQKTRVKKKTANLDPNPETVEEHLQETDFYESSYFAEIMGRDD